MRLLARRTILTIEILAGEVGDFFKKGNRGIFAAIDLHVDKSADDFFPWIMPHAAVAVSAHRLSPLAHQMDRFGVQIAISGGFRQSRHAAQPLSEDRSAVALAPSAERGAG